MCCNYIIQNVIRSRKSILTVKVLRRKNYYDFSRNKMRSSTIIIIIIQCDRILLEEVDL